MHGTRRVKKYAKDSHDPLVAKVLQSSNFLKTFLLLLLYHIVYFEKRGWFVRNFIQSIPLTFHNKNTCKISSPEEPIWLLNCYI